MFVDGGARTTDLPRDLVLGQAELLVELAERVGLLDRIEVLALDVLDERQLELLAIGQLADHGWNALEAGEAGRPDATLAGHDPVAVERFRDEDRLEDAVIGDAGRQGFEVGVLHVAPRLVRVDPDLAERDLLGAGRGVVARRDQRRQAAPQAGPLAWRSMDACHGRAGAFALRAAAVVAITGTASRTASRPVPAARVMPRRPRRPRRARRRRSRANSRENAA